MNVAMRPEQPSAIVRPTRSIVADETLPRAMQRITVGLLQGAVADLRSKDVESFDRGVHSARKKMKRLRGLLRLVRDEVGHRTFREENVVLRDTARTLAGMRDAWVLAATVQDIRERYSDLLDDETFARPEAWLLQRHEARRRIVTGAVVTNAITTLSTARSRFAHYPIDEAIRDDYGAIAGGIHRVYARGRRGLARASESHSVEDLHEWRKRVKYLRYQMEALSPLYPSLIEPTATSLDHLGELLGDDHDLAVLADVIMQHPESCRDERERWMLVALIHEQRTRLQVQALRHGRALYTESPDAFTDRIGAYWDAGRR